MLTLTHESPGRTKSSYTFSGRRINIGRVDSNDIVLAVAHISSRHATIRHREGQYVLSDLGSTNGSVVQRGDERLILGPRGQAEVVLRSEDLLLLGDIDKPVRLRVSLPKAAVGAGAQNTVVATRARTRTAELNRKVTGNAAALPALYCLVEDLNKLSRRDEILTRVTEAALQAVPGAVDALLVLADGDTLQVTGEAHRGEGICREPNSKICRQVQSGDAAILFGQHDASTLPAQTLVDRGLGSGVAAPLWLDQEVLGVLQINCEPGRFTLDEGVLDLAVVLAHHASSALEKAGLLDRLRAAEQRLRDENVLLRRRVQPEVKLVAESPAMTRAVKELERAAATDVTVLLAGETGTGKELAARYLHASSPRRSGLMVPVNCGALSETLLDSELFGYRKGAFTGASSDRKGVFEVARGGTVLLDEIGETPMSVQVRLLRVLDEGKIKVLGDAVERQVDVRIVAASNRDLARMVSEGTFRQDLYYRLRVFPITLPPLRERPEDILPLCELFAARFSGQLGKPIGALDPALVETLRRYTFPGNVRELANEIERAVVRVEPGEALTPDLLSDEIQARQPPPPGAGPQPLREQLAEVERRIIRETLGRHDGRKIPAAKELGLTRQGLAKKIDRLGLR